MALFYRRRARIRMLRRLAEREDHDIGDEIVEPRSINELVEDAGITATERLHRILLRAGLRGHKVIDEWQLRVDMAIVFGTFAAWFLIMTQTGFADLGYGAIFQALLLGPVFGVVFMLLPIRAKGKKRTDLISKDLPFTLDLLVTLVEAGLTFEGALARVVETGVKSGRPLPTELKIVVEQLERGIGRTQAMRDFAARVRCEDLEPITAAVAQNETMGGSIVRTLRAQSDSLRARRFERAREKAAKLPVKMMFPVITCIFPTLLAVTLGASFIRLAETLGNLGGVF